MIDTKEAAARTAVAEFEALSLRRRSEMRVRRWRLATTVFRILLAFGTGIYLQISHWQISGAQVGGLFLIYVASSVWQEHQMRETIQSLQTELDRLRNEVEKKSDY